MKKQIIFLFSLFLMLGNAIQAQEVFINEFRYDSEVGGEAQFVEVFGPENTVLDGWQILFYDGEKGTVYNKLDLGGKLSKACEIDNKTYGVLVFNLPKDFMQNGAPDGMALIDKDGSVVQFISYEGTFEAKEGNATGMTSTDVGVAQDASTPKSVSIQLSEGSYILAPETPKACNKSQSAQVENSCQIVSDCKDAIEEIIVKYIESSGGSSGEGCQQWKGECDLEGDISRNGSVGIGTLAKSYAKLSVVSNSAAVGGLYVEAPSNAMAAIASDGITIAAITDNGSAIYGKANTENGIAGEFVGATEVHKGVFSINDAVGEKSILVKHSGYNRFEVLNTGQINTKSGIQIAVTSNPNPIEVQNNGNVFQVTDKGQINNDSGIKINVTSNTIPILVQNNGDVFRVHSDGKVQAGEIEVKMAPFGDYVFEKEYELMTLEELQAYIQKHQHLPEIPSAKEVDENGIGLGELSHLQMIKIEELTLYLLDLNEKLEKLEHTNQDLQKQLTAMNRP